MKYRSVLTTLFLVAAIGGAGALSAGCGTTTEAVVPPDEEFGHRFDGTAPDGRTTYAIVPPDSGITYMYYPAVYDTVHVRHIPVAADLSQIEVLVKGSFPDSCTELHSVDQSRVEHIVTIDLQMRKPRGTVCASVMRPYRFYVLLDGQYDTGNYTLKLNGRVHNFVIREPEAMTDVESRS